LPKLFYFIVKRQQFTLVGFGGTITGGIFNLLHGSVATHFRLNEVFFNVNKTLPRESYGKRFCK